MSDEETTTTPLQVEIVKPKKRKKLILSISLVVVIAAGVGGYFVFHKTGNSAPTERAIASQVLKNWNKNFPLEAVKNESVTCAYDPSKYEPGYKIECDVFNAQNYAIGLAEVLFTAAPKNEWDATITLQPE